MPSFRRKRATLVYRDLTRGVIARTPLPSTWIGSTGRTEPVPSAAEVVPSCSDAPPPPAYKKRKAADVEAWKELRELLHMPAVSVLEEHQTHQLSRDALRSKTPKLRNWTLTAVFGMACAGRASLKFLNLKRGEKLANAVFLLGDLKAMQGPNITTFLHYDIACQLKPHLQIKETLTDKRTLFLTWQERYVETLAEQQRVMSDMMSPSITDDRNAQLTTQLENLEKRLKAMEKR
ncbi:hypothetical protein J4Q44_G00088330 [Coregonus suidteri]|uniref:Uncharacterized protein n=1 Tax=Coregonus suidteri TaxID=861788 RepID=A0AAN8M797_9TELE